MGRIIPGKHALVSGIIAAAVFMLIYNKSSMVRGWLGGAAA